MDLKVMNYEGSLESTKKAEDLLKAEDAAKDNFSYLSTLLTSLVHKNIFHKWLKAWINHFVALPTTITKES